MRSTKIVKDDVTSNLGDSEAALAAAPRKLSATYDFAIHTHGSIGPSCAVAEFEDGKLTCWTASQATHNLRKQLAAMLGVPDDDVRCIYVDGAGCYGRNGHEDAAADAALLARSVGRPVRVQWMRADEHGWDPKGPPTLIDLRAGFDASGNVSAWESELFIPDGTAGFVDACRRRSCRAQQPRQAQPRRCHQRSGDPLRLSQREDDGTSAGVDAAQAVLDPLAGAHCRIPSPTNPSSMRSRLKRA